MGRKIKESSRFSKDTGRPAKETGPKVGKKKPIDKEKKAGKQRMKKMRWQIYFLTYSEVNREKHFL